MPIEGLDRYKAVNWGRSVGSNQDMESRSHDARISRDCTTLGAAFLSAAVGNRAIFRVDGAEKEQCLSYGELKARAYVIAGQLAAAGATPGQSVILIMEDPIAFAGGFWACALGGFVAVPLPPMENQAQRERVTGAVAVLGQPWLISDGAIERADEIGAGLRDHFVLQAPNFERISDVPDGPEPTPEITAGDIAVIQFSSGTTGQPKGVQLSHAMVLANVRAMSDRIGLTDDDKMVNWMPLSHDFGLFHFHILPLLAGIDQVLMTPATFVRKPIAWIRAMDRHKATISGAPNFALKMIANLMKPARAATFDLSSMRQITNGAEPLDSRSIEAFLDALRPADLAPSVIRPAYGLAEATLTATMTSSSVPSRILHIDRSDLDIGVAVREVSAGDDAAMSLYALGRPIDGSDLRIVDPGQATLGENIIGHIQLRGPSVMVGYINNPDASAAVLLGDGWLETGDIGFLNEGDLVMTGRAKEVIIVNGLNFYPPDIEAVAETTPGLTGVNTIAVAQSPTGRGDGGGEAVLAFVRFRGDLEKFAGVAQAIEDTVLAKTGLAVDHCLAVHDMPRTTSGKLQRFNLAARFAAGKFDDQILEIRSILASRGRPLVDAVGLGNASLTARMIADEAARLIGEDVDTANALMEQGLSSLQAVTLCARLASILGGKLDIAAIFDHPTARDLAEFLITRDQGEDAEKSIPKRSGGGCDEVAVIGYGCEFPGGANDPEAFWRLLDGDADPVGPIPSDRWIADPANMDGVPGLAAFLDDIDVFDPAFFGIAPAEAEALDPQQRLLFRVLWQSLEHAGLDPDRLRGRRVGLFIGLSDTGLAAGDTRLIADPATAWTHGVTGTATSIAVGRLSHHFDFRGPALAVDTACSSSLVAVDMAMRALRYGECELAIAGGANILLSPDLHAGLARMGALAADGRCKTFAAEADGYGRGEGAGLFVLKVRDGAEAEGDTIHGVLLGGALNHDGASQNVTAPNGQAQRQLLRRALWDADIAGSDVNWVETHGTGTPLGDPIEVAALVDVLSRKGSDVLPLGAVKSRIGHLEAAAGAAGLMKVLLALRHRRIPGNRKRAAPNPNIDWLSIAARPVDTAVDWPCDARRRRIAGVSAFGMSGTNAHVLIADGGGATDTPEKIVDHRPLLAFGARDAGALDKLRDAWLRYLATIEPAEWPALLAAAAGRRGGHGHRMAVALDPAAKDASLQHLSSARGVEALHKPTILFAFTGQGAQSPMMLSALYRDEPVYRAAFDEASAAAGPIDGKLLGEWLYGESAADKARIDQTDLAQPALVAVAWGLVRLWSAWGIRPDGVIGHSMGEIPAALVAGALDISTAMTLAVLRGRVMQSDAPEGHMVGVSAGVAAVEPLLGGLKNVVIAGINGPRAITVSGPPDGISEFVTRVEAAGLKYRPLEVTRAFHGPEMTASSLALAASTDLAAARPLGLPLFSTMTGENLAPTAMLSADYWCDQMLTPVRFSEAVTTAAATGFDLMIEIGPRAMLSTLGPASAPKAVWIAGHDVDGEDGVAPLAAAAAQVWRAGGPIDWRAYFGGRGMSADRLPRHPMNLITLPRNPWGAANTGTPVGKPAENPMPIAAAATLERRNAGDVLETVIHPLLGRVAGLAAGDIIGDQSFLAHGMDSLMIVQLQRAIKGDTGLDIPVRGFYEGNETPNLLAELIAENLTETTPPPETGAVMGSMPHLSGGGDIHALMQAQLQAVQNVINRQLETLAGTGVVAKRSKPATVKPAGSEIKGLFSQPVADGQAISVNQQTHIGGLAADWNAKSSKSKAAAASDRRHVASSRAVFGFRPDYKEMVYPLMVDRAEGAKVWDVDGNEYVDVTMGFGVYLFGHNPPFVKDAMIAEMERGGAIGPASPLAGEVASRIHDLTGVDRCAFFSTGTEAIMCAARLARAVTGRERLVIFKGAYHGSFDGVLATGWIDADGHPEAMPMTDGTLDGMVDKMIVLDYGDMAGLDVIERYADEIALVLVEPVQSRNPGNLPVEFLHALRKLTADRDVPLLFDEIITGFRFDPGGMQAVLGIEADIVTYGKVLGHGQPFGVVAGKARFMDAVDGGQWSYGDDSAPGVRTAFVAGTFNGHPMSLAAARAVLDKVAEDNGALQADLAAKTEDMCRRLDEMFVAEDVPVRMERYGSLFRFDFGEDTEILNTHLLNNGVFVWEQRNCFLSTAHSHEDIEKIIDAASAGVLAMKADGWFDAALATATDVEILPLTKSQTAMWHRAHDPAALGLWTDIIAIDLDGTLDEDRLAAAVDQVVHRHPMLSAIAVSQSKQIHVPAAHATLERLDVSGARDPGAWLAAWMDAVVRQPFKPYRAEMRLALAKRSAGRYTLIALGSHLSFDGWSFALIMREILAAYEDLPLAAPDTLAGYLSWEATAQPISGVLPPVAMVLPGVSPEPAIDQSGNRLTRTDWTPLFDAIAARARETENTPFVMMLGAYAILLSRLVNQPTVTIGLPGAGQIAADMFNLVGNVSFVRPLTVELDGQEDIDQFLRRLQSQVTDEARQLPAEDLPRRHVLFNLDGPIRLTADGLEIGMRPVPIIGARADLFVNLLIVNGRLLVDVDWPAARFEADAVAKWVEDFGAIISRVAAGGGRVADIAAAVSPEHSDSGVVDWFKLPALADVVGHLGAANQSTETTLAVIDQAGKRAVLGPQEKWPRLPDGHADLAELEASLSGLADGAPVAVSLSNDMSSEIRPIMRVAVGRDSLDMTMIRRLRRHARRFLGASVRVGEIRPASQTPDLSSVQSKNATGLQSGVRGETERRLAEIWQNLLGGQVLSGSDDFFECGGGSLSGVRLVAALRDAFGVAITLGDIFDQPVLSDMAALIDSREAGSETVFHAGDRTQAPTAPQQRRLWLLEQMAETGVAYNISVTLDFPWHLEIAALKHALALLGERHDSLRTAITIDDEMPVQVMADQIEVLLAVEDLRQHDNWPNARIDRVRSFAEAEISLDQAPLWRAALLQTPNGDCLVLTVHHIIADVWSLEVMLHDLLESYRAVRLGTAPLLENLQIQYGDYCRWINLDATADLAKAAAYWQMLMEDVPALTTMPGDRQRPVEKSFAGARRRTALSGALLTDLRDSAKESRSSLFQAVMAAVAVVTGRRCGAEDLVLGTVSAARDRAGLENQIGLFTNTLPIRLNLNGGKSLGNLVGHARERLLAAAAHDLASLDEIVQAAGHPRDPSHNPLFEICVTLDDRQTINRIGATHGVQIEEVATPTTQFDLSFYVMESADTATLEVTYATAIFDRPTVDHILAEIVEILAEIAADPDRCLEPLGTLAKPSPHQERLWFVDRFENGELYAAAPVYYNMPLLYPLDASITAEILMQRLVALYAALPVLNTCFSVDGELPALTADKPQIPPVTEIIGDSAEDGYFAGGLAEFVGKPFDIASDGLLRVGVMSDATGGRILVLVAHHIVLDILSLAEIHRLLVTGATLSENAVGFHELAGEQRQSDAVLPQELEFWRRDLGGDPPRLLLPVDRPRPAIHTFTLGAVGAGIDATGVPALAKLANDLSCTVDDIVLAAFVNLLQHLSGQAGIVLGTTTANRFAGERCVLGPVTNLVTLKFDVDRATPVERFIRAIADTVNTAVAHGKTPFDKVVLDLKPKNDMSRTALFDVLYVRDELPERADNLQPPAIGWGKYDLTLAAKPGVDGGLNLCLAFNRDIFDDATAAHWLSLFGLLLAGLPAALTDTLADWPLISADQSQRLIANAAPATDLPPPPATTLPAAFALRVAAAPEAVAVVDGDIQLSFAMVDQRANGVANSLIAMGVGIEDRVAVILPRGADWPVAMLGVVKAGAAFVPFDTEAAIERSLAIMEDADIKALVLGNGIDEALVPEGLPVLRIDSDALSQASDAAPEVDVAGNSLAYVIFTSGSTGRPKGVMIEHHSVLSLILGQGDLFELAAGDVWSWFHSPAFDFSIWEIWGSLLTGGRLVVVPRAAQLDVMEFRKLLCREKVSVLSLTPSAFYALAAHEEDQPAADLSVRSVWFGGEALTPSNLRPWAKAYPHCRLLNLFGITETTVHVTFRPLGAADLQRADSVIGDALPSYSVTIRDENLRPLPAGVAGEIVVGGSGVARGYLNRPELTAERFVEDPITPGQRLYRSGDLGRATLGGDVVYLGRMDDQIKLRGFRIEPGEIEDSLLSLPEVRAAVAGIVRDGDGLGDGDGELVAWLVADDALDPDTMANSLAPMLPAYMIPRHYYLVDAIPLTGNGKADMRALAHMRDSALGEKSAGDMPEPGLESDLAGIWRGVLNIDELGRDDNFFEHGGHSLKANQAVLRIRRNLGLEISLKDFFSAQSIAALAALLRGRESVEEAVLPLAPKLSVYPLSSPQRRLFAMQQSDPASVAYNMVGGFVLTGALDGLHLASAFADLINRHEVLRSRFDWIDGAPAQIVGPEIQQFDLPSAAAPANEDEDTTIERALAGEFAHVFDLTDGQPLRANLIELSSAPSGNCRTLLVINVHHIAADGWSVTIMMSDLAAFYRARGEGIAMPAPLDRQYKDFAYWQAHAFSGQTEHPALAFWRKRLVNGSVESAIPTDFQRPADRAGQGAMVRQVLGTAASADLRRAATDAGTTLFATFTALLHALLHLRSGAAATMIGAADAGRDQLEVEDQVGFYLNLMAFGLSADPTAPLSSWIAAATEEAAAVFEHKAYPFDLVLEALELSAKPGHSPVFDILLLLQNNATPTGRFGELGIKILADRTVSSKYDLNLMVEDRPEIELVLEYDSALFREDTARWFLDDLLRLIEALSDGQDRAPAEILQTVIADQDATNDVGMLDENDPLLGPV